jgi:endonuclease/exonuclease/phosphatase family metal-dependent hydrolase
MSVVKGLPRLRALVIGIAVVLAGALYNAPAASAASVRLRVLDFNACDQYGRGNAACAATPTQRASAIVQSINSYAPNVVTLQEVCHSTVDMTLASLGPAWKAQFFSTYTTTDPRCQSVDHTWGIAVLARSPVLANPQSFTLGVETSGEVRTLLCIDVAVGLAVRACTTHLTSGSNANAAVQSNKAVDQVNPWTTANTVLVGGDFNLNVRACGNTDVSTGLRGWYSTRFGAGVTRCYTGVGSMYEVDQYRAGGDGVYDETTLGSVKIDFVFGNRQHVNADVDGDATSSSLSDHDPLRGALTAHD